MHTLATADTLRVPKPISWKKDTLPSTSVFTAATKNIPVPSHPGQINMKEFINEEAIN